MLDRLSIPVLTSLITLVVVVLSTVISAGICMLAGVDLNWVLLGLLEGTLVMVCPLVTYPYIKLYRHAARLEQRLQDAASFDVLTGFYNRGVFSEMAASAWSLAKRYEREMVVIMIELDHFDEVRSEQGDGMADAVLKAFGDLMNEQRRTSDFIGRWTDSRCAVVLPDTPASGGLKFADRVLKAASRMKVVHKGSTVSTTISIGVAVYEPPERINGIKEMLLRSERAMFHSIDSGRDRSMLYTRFTS